MHIWTPSKGALEIFTVLGVPENIVATELTGLQNITHDGVSANLILIKNVVSKYIASLPANMNAPEFINAERAIGAIGFQMFWRWHPSAVVCLRLSDITGYKHPDLLLMRTDFVKRNINQSGYWEVLFVRFVCSILEDQLRLSRKSKAKSQPESEENHQFTDAKMEANRVKASKIFSALAWEKRPAKGRVSRRWQPSLESVDSLEKIGISRSYIFSAMNLEAFRSVHIDAGTKDGHFDALFVAYTIRQHTLFEKIYRAEKAHKKTAQDKT